MKDYLVNLTIPVYLTIRVEADDAEDAYEKAYDLAYLDSYVGNGGMDKIVGTNETNVSIEAGEVPLEGDFNFEISVEVNNL